MDTEKAYFQDFIYEGNNNQVVLFIHGIYSCPAQFEIFYPDLKERGYSIYSILLEGHGKELNKLAKVKYKDWNKQVNEIVYELAKKYEKVYVVGHSMGGLLALDTVEEYVSKRVLIAPAIRVRVTWRYIKLGLVIDNEKVKDQYVDSCRKVVGVVFPRRFFKKLLTVPCFYQLFKLIIHTDINLKKITKPILIIQSFKDECVSPRGPKRIVKSVGSLDRTIVWLKKSYHGVFEENEEKLMIKKLLQFIES